MIQYIQVETNEKGEIVGLGFVDSMTDAYLAVKKKLAVESGLDAVNDAVSDHVASIKHIAQCEGENRERQELQDILSKHSELAPSSSIGDHIAAIKNKAHLGGLDKGRKYTTKILAKYSELDPSEAVNKHIAVIQEAAWCRGANAKTDELQNILSVHSGLERENSIGDHIAAIKLKAHDQGYDKGWHDKQADIQKRIKQFEEAIKSE